MISEPELIREILVSNSDSYEKYESHPLVRQLEGNGLLSLTGDKWAHHRKIISPTFYMDNLKLLIPFVGKSVVKVMEERASLSIAGELELDVSELFHSMTEDAITQTAFGMSFDEGKSVFQLQAKQMVFAVEAFRNVFIPGYRFLPTQKNMDSWRLEKEINRSLVRLIDARKELNLDNDEMKIETTSQEAKDMLGLLIDAGDKNSMATSMTTVSVRDIVEECKTFFFAGKHTTSNLLTWATVLIAMHPEWQEKARDEVIKVCGSRDLPTRDNVTKLKTLGMILNETLRLYPPVVATIRRSKADVELGGRYMIPKGTELLVPIMAVHHDQELWGPDAHDFNPARFKDGVVRASRKPNAFIPFGLGARTCVGRNLALLESKLTLAILIQRFSLRLSPSYVHAPTVLMLLQPQFGAPVVFKPLSSDQLQSS